MEIRRLQINIYEQPNGETRVEYDANVKPTDDSPTIVFCNEVLQAIQHIVAQNAVLEAL